MTKLSIVNRYSIVIAAISLATIGGAAYRIIAAGGGSGATNSTGNNSRQPIANSNGLIAWYPLDGDARDNSVNHNDGTLSNFTLDGTTNGWTTGKFGKALLFNGSSDYVSLPPSPSLTITSYSFSAWIKTTNAGSGRRRVITLQPYTGPYRIMSLNGNVLEICDNDAGVLVTKGVALNDGQWHSIVVTKTAGSEFDWYVDGIRVGTQPTTNNTGFTLTGGTYIGTYDGITEMFNGSIDDARIYNRALSASEVSSLYAGTPSQNCDQTCKIWLKFDDNTGTTAKDSVGTRSGTLNGTVTWTSGNFASAVSLDGSTGYVSVPDLGMTSGTVDTWINPASVSGDQRLLSQTSGASTQAGSLAINQSSGENGSLWVWDGSAWQRLANDGTIVAGKWNQIVVTYNGSTTTAYINGIQQLTTTAAFNFNGVSANIGGKYLGTTGGTFNGSVDDFRTYSRILSPEEITDQWRQGT